MNFLRAQARMKKPRPTSDRGSACQTIWCRYASRIAGSMAPFSAKRKGRQSFAPRFVYLPKVQIKQMRGKVLSTSRGRPFPTASFNLCPSRTMASWARSQEADFHPAEYRQSVWVPETSMPKPRFGLSNSPPQYGVMPSDHSVSTRRNRELRKIFGFCRYRVEQDDFFRRSRRISTPPAGLALSGRVPVALVSVRRPWSASSLAPPGALAVLSRTDKPATISRGPNESLDANASKFKIVAQRMRPRRSSSVARLRVR
jgi:hypothetical protein